MNRSLSTMLVTGVLIGILPIVTGAVTIQYDDGIMEDLSQTAEGQTVRFTLPSSASTYMLEELHVYVGSWMNHDTIIPTIWADNEGPLATAVGSAIHRQLGTVNDDQWYTYDLTAANITLPGGSSIFGGWTCYGWLTAHWDSTDPDNRSLFDYSGLPKKWLEVGYDAPIRLTVSAVPDAGEAALLLTFGLVGLCAIRMKLHGSLTF